jgi:hypothetical protein
MAHTRLRRVAGIYRFTTKMTADAFASFRRFLHPLLCLLGMSQPLGYNDEFPENRIVQDWERSLLERYHDNVQYRARLKSCRITRIRRYKKAKGLEHEYLIAEVLDPVSGSTRYLQVERTAADPDTRTAVQDGQDDARSNLSTQSSLASSKQLAADDHVTTRMNWPSGKENKCIEKFDCESGGLVLLDLVIVAKSVHDHSDRYRLFKRQCFWYSDMIAAVLRQVSNNVQDYFSVESVELDHSEEAEVEMFEASSGTFRSIRIYTQRKSMIDDVYEQFEPRKRELLSTVCLDSLLNNVVLVLTYSYCRSRRPKRKLDRLNRLLSSYMKR